MTVLAPPHTGLTGVAQPVLYWYLSAPWAGPLEFTLNQAGRIEPVLELTLNPPPGQAHPQGIQGLRLSDQGVSLKPGVEYEWFVSIVPDAEQRSGDLLTSATLRYTQPDPSLRAALARHPVQDWPALYAQRGYWYDAVAQLSHLISTQPQNTQLRQKQATLIEQVQLPKVAHDILQGG